MFLLYAYCSILLIVTTILYQMFEHNKYIKYIPTVLTFIAGFSCLLAGFIRADQMGLMTIGFYLTAVGVVAFLILALLIDKIYQ